MGFISRWWRSKGYGIHSPYAFRLVTEVLPERGRYYAYSEIERMSDSSRLKLLFRLVCEFRPATVFGPFLCDDEKAVILMADSRVRFVTEPDDADLVIGFLPRLMREGQVAVLWSSDGVWSEFKTFRHSGMTFSNGRYGIAVNRPGIPRQDFETRF